jgi:hypothetical protein
MKAVAIIQQSCSDSLAIANPTDRVFGTDSGLLAAFFFAMNALVCLQGTRSAGRLHVFLRLYTTLPNSFLRALAL